MKRLFNSRSGLPAAVVAGVLSFALLSWDFKQPGSVFFSDEHSDTLPPGREKKIRNLDDVLKELDEAQLKLDKDLKSDMEKIHKEVEASIKKIDMNKIKMELENSLKEIDMAKIQMDVEASIAKIDWDKMKTELEKVKEMDFSKLELDMKKMEEDLKKIGPEIEKSMEKAKKDLEKAKNEMQEYKSFQDALEKEGLIETDKEYIIEHKNEELLINGKKQSAELYNKHRRFLEKHKKFRIEKSGDHFNIDID